MEAPADPREHELLQSMTELAVKEEESVLSLSKAEVTISPLKDMHDEEDAAEGIHTDDAGTEEKLPGKEVRVGLVYDERMCNHKCIFEKYHPEQPARITSIYQRLQMEGLVERCVAVAARVATDEELLGVHMVEHVQLMREVSSRRFNNYERRELSNKFNSIFFNTGSSEAALLAAGSVVELAVQVAKGDLHSGAAVVRPPGHHAETHTPMGFCLFNNVAVAAHVLLHQKPELGIKKILLVDWDVHHGNGTQNMFWEDPQLLYFSVHRYEHGSFYPGGIAGDCDHVGGGKGLGYNINVPWPGGGFGDADYLAVWDQVLLPVAEAYQPDMVLVSAGFDAAEGDPLGGCKLTPSGYALLTQKLMGLAKGRFVLALEGGYNLQSIAASYTACTSVLLGDPPLPLVMSTDHEQLLPRTFAVINKVRKALVPHWGMLEGDVEMPKSVFAPAEGLSNKLAALHIQYVVEDAQSDTCLTASGNITPRSNSSFDSEFIVTDSYVEEARSSHSNVPEPVFGHTAATERFQVGSPVEEPWAENAAAAPNETVEEGQNPIGEPRWVSPEKAAIELEKLSNTYVWYASYGSNMSEERFMCYIVGGKISGMAVPAAGCQDKTPPVESTWVEVRHRMFFGRQSTATWGRGGVSFLDPRPSFDGATSHLKLYKITLLQFNEVVAQENRMSAPANNSFLLGMDGLLTLRQGGADTPHNTLELIKGGWYGTVKYLGDKDGAPVLTFTCSLADIDKFDAKQLPKTPPSEPYRDVLVQSLVTGKNMSPATAHAYIDLRIPKTTSPLGSPASPRSPTAAEQSPRAYSPSRLFSFATRAPPSPSPPPPSPPPPPPPSISDPAHKMSPEGGAGPLGSEDRACFGSAGGTAGRLGAERRDETYVWYACYGSNMLTGRFMCYIQGGKVKEMKEGCEGARDKSPPLESRWMDVPHRMFFGHSYTSSWGHGGVCFLDPTPSTLGLQTKIKLYKITLQQLNDVVAQENCIGVAANNPDFLSLQQISTLQTACPESDASTLTVIKNAWYGCLKCLGTVDGLPVITITCSPNQMQNFARGEWETGAPSERYAEVVVKGLTEEGVLQLDEAQRYVKERALLH